MFSTISDHLSLLLVGVIVAIMGGIANWLMSDDHSIFQFVVAVFLAGFAGFLVGELCIEAQISDSWAFFFCGSAGLSAEMILKIARRSVVKRFGTLTNEQIDNELDEIEKNYRKRKQNLIKKKNKTEEPEEEQRSLKDFIDGDDDV